MPAWGLIAGAVKVGARIVKKAAPKIVKAARGVISRVGGAARTPTGRAVIGAVAGGVAGTAAGAALDRPQDERGSLIYDRFVETHGRAPDPNEMEILRNLANTASWETVWSTMASMKSTARQGSAASGTGLLGGAMPMVVEPEFAEVMRCPKGYSLADFGDGPACYPTKVLVALGVKKSSRRGGGITARELAAARKVQRFGSGLFVNKQPKVKLRKKGR